MAVSLQEQEQAVQELIHQLQEAAMPERLDAAAELTSLGMKAHAAVPALIEALHDEAVPVRKMATLALGVIGPAARAAVPELLQVLRETLRSRKPASESFSTPRERREENFEGIRKMIAWALREIEPGDSWTNAA